MKDVTVSTDVLRRLRDLGVRLTIDDFGTAYSSLGRLKRFPIAQLKIDRSFVDGLPEDADDLAIVTAVITMGHSLGLNVLAEGIETEAQLTALQSLGCDLGQGFLFSHALPEAEFTRWICEHDFRATSSPVRAAESDSLRAALTATIPAPKQRRQAAGKVLLERPITSAKNSRRRPGRAGRG
jgi:sensor c-di-GMP phosphodiesterase-like protein